jgi:hypothetical protein
MNKSHFVCVTACTTFLVCLLVWSAPRPAVADTFQRLSGNKSWQTRCFER